MKTNDRMTLLLILSTLLFSVRGMAQVPLTSVLDCYDTSREVSYILNGRILQSKSDDPIPPATDFVEMTVEGQMQPPVPVRYLYRGWTVHEAHFVLGTNDAVINFSDLDYMYHSATETGEALAFANVKVGPNAAQTLHCKFRK